VVETQFPAARASREKLDAGYIRVPTAVEKAMAYGIFGAEISMDTVRVHQPPRSCVSMLASVNSPRDIFFWGATQHSHDYARDANPYRTGTYAHEATHIWQRQNSHKFTNLRLSFKLYHYPLDLRKWSFNDYGIEQQASIIGDYTQIFLHGGTRPTKWLHATGADTPAGREKLKKLVEDRFPQARNTRLYFEQHGHLPSPPEKQQVEQPGSSRPSAVNGKFYFRTPIALF